MNKEAVYNNNKPVMSDEPQDDAIEGVISQREIDRQLYPYKSPTIRMMLRVGGF